MKHPARRQQLTQPSRNIAEQVRPSRVWLEKAVVKLNTLFTKGCESLLTRYSRQPKLNAKRNAQMWSRLISVAAITFGLLPQAEAGEQSGVVLRASCTVV